MATPGRCEPFVVALSRVSPMTTVFPAWNIPIDRLGTPSIATIVEECRRAVAWVVGEGVPHGTAADRLVVGGHSAGGHLAAMLLATDWTPFGLAREPIAGAVSLSGVHDLAPMVQFSFNAD